MATSEVEIINAGLGHLGQNPISSLEDDTPTARKATVQWPISRDEVLRAHAWSCAAGRIILNPLVGEPVFGYSYKFQLPQNPFCLRVLSTRKDYVLGEKSSKDNEGYEINGRELLSNENTIYLTYIKRLLEVAIYDASLVRALASRLAYDLAYQITASRSAQDSMKKKYDDDLLDARILDGKEKGRLFKWSRSITARG